MAKLHRNALCASLLLALPLALAAIPALAQAQAPRHSFDIPAQDLGGALMTFGLQSRLQVVAPSQLIQGRTSAPVHGALADEEALRRLLQGSGLDWQRDAVGIRIKAAASATPSADVAQQPQADPTQLDDVLVVGWRPEDGYRVDQSSSATRTGTPLRDVPQSMQIVPRQVMQDQQIVRLTDALQNVSSVQMNGTGGNRGETYQVRGFVSGRYAINGFQLTSAMDRPEAFMDLANVEQVEVLKGPSSVMYGLSEPGGVINVVTRAPTQQFQADGALQVGNYDFHRTEGSVSGALDKAGTLTARVTGAWQNSGGFRDGASDSRRSFGAAALRWQPDEATQVDLAIDHVNQSQPFDRGLIATDAGVFARNAKTYYGESWSHTGAHKTVVSLIGQRTVAPWLTLRASSRYSDARVQDHNAVDLQGVEDDGRTVRRRITNRIEDSNDLNLRFDAIIDASTGGIEHRILAGVERTDAQMTFDSARANIGSIDLYAPVHGATPVPVARPNAYYDYDATMNSAYLQDQMALSERWKLLLSLRYDQVESTQDDWFNQEVAITDDSELTGRAGVVYQPNTRTSLYASYTESFQPQQGQLRDGSPLTPERGQQVEIGAKFELVPERLSLTTALFEITKQDVATEDPTDPDFSILTGEQRVRGFEVDVTGQIARHWRLLANVSLLDPEITRDNVYAVGNRLVGVPKYSGRVWLHHDFDDLLPGFKLGGGVTVVGARQVDLDNSFEIDGYTTFDATASYAFNDRFELSLRANNLTDRFFVEGVQASNNLYPGAPRSYSLQLRAKF